MALRQECGDAFGASGGMRILAKTWQGLGEHHKAIALCRESIALGKEVMADGREIARSLDTLAVSLQQTGQTEEAVECWLEAARYYDDRHWPERAQLCRERAENARDGG